MKLKASERRLLLIFLGLFAVIVGGFGTTFLVRHFGGSAAEIRGLAERRDSMAKMLSESELWGARSRWIDERIPGFPSREEASSHLLDAVSQGAETADVEIRKKQLITDPDTATDRGGATQPASGAVYFDRVAVVLELAGSEEEIFRWLHRIQQPGSFLGVTHLTYVRTESGVRCNAQVSLWFRESSAPNLAKSP